MSSSMPLNGKSYVNHYCFEEKNLFNASPPLLMHVTEIHWNNMIRDIK